MTPKALATLIAKAAKDIKAIDLTILNLSKLSGFTDYFVICSGKSDTQVRAIADSILKKTKLKDKSPIGVEGYQRGLWVLVDFGAVVAHIFYNDVREYYGLEKFWGDAKRVSVY